MCQFCENTKAEKDEFYKWANANPYQDDDLVDYEGIDYLLDGTKFIISCAFDSGYLGDEMILTFKYCPMCSRKL